MEDLELASAYTGELSDRRMSDFHPIDLTSMFRPTSLGLAAGWLFAALAPAQAQTLLSQFKFDGNLLNESTFVDSDMNPAPDGTFREGTDAVAAPAGTAIFGRGVDGVAAGALRLDGVDDWVDLTTAGHPGKPIPGTFTSGPGLVSGTVMTWVRFDSSLDQSARWILGNANSANSQSYRFGWNGEKLESNASGSNGADKKFTVADSSANLEWADGKWHHIAASWDGFENRGRVFVDGVQVGTNVMGTTLTTATPQASWSLATALGARNNAGTIDGFWSGLIDDFRVYAAQLSPAQVLAIYNQTTIAPDPADFDQNGQVDGIDFLIWQRGFGIGTTPAEGDANGDHVVDAADLTAWKDAMNGVFSTATVAAVPEPSAAMLLVAAVGGLAGFRRR
jgi:hypothetical protein